MRSQLTYEQYAGACIAMALAEPLDDYYPPRSRTDTEAQEAETEPCPVTVRSERGKHAITPVPKGSR